MSDQGFVTNRSRVLLCVARDPDARQRDISETLDITERRVSEILRDLTERGWLAKEKVGRRNTYQVRADVLVEDGLGRACTIGELLESLGGTATT